MRSLCVFNRVGEETATETVGPTRQAEQREGLGKRNSELDEHNAKFACKPAAGADFHRRLSKRLELKWVFCLEAERVVSNNLVVRFENRFLQLKPKCNQGLGAAARVTV